MRKFIVFAFVALSLCSCELLNTSLRSGDVKVARIGKHVLYESEITKLMPSGVSPEDSAHMVRQYINTWALSQLLLLKAEENLSKPEKNIDVEVEEFRQTLLGYRYEKIYIEERLDTIITVDEQRKYFDEHMQNYTFPYSLVKARVIKISKTSPYYEIIKAAYNVTEEKSVDELEELCYSSADKYVDFDKKWISIDYLAKELGEDAATCERDISTGNALELTVNGNDYLVFIAEKVAPGDISPFEYNTVRIKDAIISKRKQEVLATLERDLLNDAINNKILKIYNKNE